ncbi:MAG: apolipoprotein N-acyltransferase [Planctomycetaceae bacterium]|nr:apolipoprotein N-acyltransferase [Planctomycetaceae bacterium]
MRQPSVARKNGTENRSLPGWCPAALAAGLWAASLPPIGIGVLSFLAPAAFLLLCLPKQAPTNLRVVFWWGLMQWMLTFHFIRLPHWAGWVGWPILGGYFACYNVLLVAGTRRLIHRAGWPPFLTLPMVWVSLELLRSTLLTGFPMGQLGHSLFRYPLLIQTADLAGDLTVSFLVSLVGASSAELFLARTRRNWLPMAALGGSLGLMFGYGYWGFVTYEIPKSDGKSVRVALIQGARDVRFGLTAEEDRQETLQSFRSHQQLTARARQNGADVVVWAESMFPATDVLPFDAEQYLQLIETRRAADDSLRTPPSLELIESLQQELPFQVRETTGTGPVGVYPYQTSVPLIVGMRSFDPIADADYNAAVYFDRDGHVAHRYFKFHLVPFGEYLPLGETFPWLYQMAPMSRGLTPGPGVAIFAVNGRRFVPTICYESVIGRVVRDYLLSDQHESTPPASHCDALLNVSNDGWFWGASALDLHLASNVFRAVENRTPHFVVCNTGISAEIDPSGRIVQELPKREQGMLLVDSYPRPAAWFPYWWKVGNGPWWLLTAILVLGLVRSWVPRVRSDRSNGSVRSAR